MRPSETAIRFLRWFCREDCVDELEGDLIELYQRESALSLVRAKWMLRWRVLKYVRPEFLKIFHRKSKLPVSMYRNYFATAWRNLLKNKLSAALNIVGLSIGISACIVIYNIVAFELSFNQSIASGDRIYRLYSQFKGAYEGANAGVSTGLQAMIKTEFTGIDKIVNLETYSAKVKVPASGGNPERTFDEQRNIVITGPMYFDLINGFRWTAGSAANALSQPFQVVLTEDKARTYFGTSDFTSLLGREIRYQDSLVLSVAGIVKPPSYNTDFSFTDYVSFPTIDKSFLKLAGFQSEGWENTSSGSQLLIRLSPGTSADNIRTQLLKADARYKASNINASYYAEYGLQPLSDLHFNTELGSFEFGRTANKTALLILGSIGLLLLIIAAINFINLETAQADKRAKEVGVRKVLGGVRSQLLRQFLSQSLLITFLATVLSTMVAQISMWFFQDYIPAGVTLHLLSIETILFLSGMVIIVGTLAGFYPAIIMSSFQPVYALKNNARHSGNGTRSAVLRRGLIVFQFSVAQVLIIGTMVMISQINFMISKDLGFKKEAIITFHVPYYERREKLSLLRNELQRVPELESVSMANETPSAATRSSRTVKFKTKSGEIETQVSYKYADENYIPLFGLKLLSGRGLLPSDTAAQVVINETYLKHLHLTPEDAVGQEVWFLKSPHTIIGVVRDFNTLSLREGLLPLMLQYRPGFTFTFAAKVNENNRTGENLTAVLAKMEAAWSKLFPDERFSPEFYDQTLANYYTAEQRMSRMSFAAMTVAILLCSLGLFGLVSFNAASKVKEIGVRKTLGASVGSIILLLSKDIVILVVVAFVIATPVAYYAASRFLETFAFRMTLTWQLFVAAGVVSVVLALATACQQALKAALANPVKSLRSE